MVRVSRGRTPVTRVRHDDAPHRREEVGLYTTASEVDILGDYVKRFNESCTL